MPSRSSAKLFHGPRSVVAVLLAFLTVIGLAACAPPSRSLVVTATPSAPSAASFITISGGMVVERDAVTGRPTRTLARNVTSAAESADGTMLYASGSSCSNTIAEVNRAKQPTPVVDLKNAVSDVSVSRDGRWIGYLTFSHCPINRCPGSSCAGAARYGPNVAVITNTATKHSIRLTTQPGSGISGVTFSPDARRFAMWLNNSFLIMTTAHPVLATAERLNPPRGCVYGQAAWTTRGIFTGKSCGPDPSPAMPTRLILLDPDQRGARTTHPSIPLPKCIDGFHVVADPAQDAVLTTATTGYGDGGCAGNNTTHVSSSQDGALTELMNAPPGATGIQAVA